MTGSPWERALGPDFELLHPRLRHYFGSIPPGSIGYGSGVFDVVGTPRLWLWPVLAVLSADAIVFPVWQRNVPFRVRNVPGHAHVGALRRFEFASGARTMVDEISWGSEGLQDRLGRRGWVRVTLVPRVLDGMVRLTSSRTWLFGIPLARTVSPRVELTERWDDDARCQRVTLRISAPVVGTVYQYSGHFTYNVKEVGNA